MRTWGILIISILAALVMYAADADKKQAPIDTGIPSGTVRSVSMEKVLLITNGPADTNTVSASKSRTTVVAAQTNTTENAGAKLRHRRRNRSGSGRHFIDVDGDGVADDRDL